MLTPETIAEAIKASGIRRDKNPGTMLIKAATDTVVSPTNGAVTYDQDIVIPRFRPRVRELLPEARVSTGLVGFFASTTEGTADIVEEDGAKPQMSSSATLTTLPLVNIAGLFKVTDEVLDDYPRFVAAIEQEGRDAKDDIIENQLLNGTGTSGELLGLMVDTSIPTAGGYTSADLGEAIVDLSEDGYDVTGIVMSQSLFNAMVGATAGTIGDFAMVSYDRTLTLFGVPVVITSKMTGNHFLVGDFRRGAKLFTHGTSVDVGYDDDDFSHNRVSIRFSERMNLAIKDPNAFRKI